MMMNFSNAATRRPHSIHTATTTLLCASLATLASCEKPKPAGLPVQDPAVSTVIVGTRDVPVTHDFPATIASPQMVDINARVSGWLLAQDTPDGATVKKNQLLYSVDPAQYKIQLDASNAQLAQANAQLESTRGQLAASVAQQVYAQATYDRNKTLVASGAVSKESWDQITANLAEANASVEQANGSIAVAQASVLSATASIENAKLNLEWCTIESPLDGIMGASEFFEGSLVGESGKQLLNTVVQMDPMWASFSPSANFLPVILALQADGQLPATVTLTGAMQVPAPGAVPVIGANAPTAQGRLVMVNNQISGTSDTILLRVEFPNGTGLFRPGAYATVTVELGTRQGVTVVPRTAVFARQTELFVWKVNADQTVESVAVEPISVFEQDLLISSGVTAGTKIVSEGVGKLRAGMKVRDVAAATAAPAATPPAAATPPTTTSTSTKG